MITQHGCKGLIDVRLWPIADLHSQGLIGSNRCKPVYRTDGLIDDLCQISVARKTCIFSDVKLEK